MSSLRTTTTELLLSFDRLRHLSGHEVISQHSILFCSCLLKTFMPTILALELSHHPSAHLSSNVKLCLHGRWLAFLSSCAIRCLFSLLCALIFFFSAGVKFCRRALTRSRLAWICSGVRLAYLIASRARFRPFELSPHSKPSVDMSMPLEGKIVDDSFVTSSSKDE